MTSEISLAEQPVATTTTTKHDPKPIVYIFFIISLSVAVLVIMTVVTKMIRRKRTLSVEQSHMSVMTVDEKDDAKLFNNEMSLEKKRDEY
jgi:hypothetical protein